MSEIPGITVSNKVSVPLSGLVSVNTTDLPFLAASHNAVSVPLSGLVSVN